MHEQSTIIKDEELILKALGAETASTDGTGKAIGPTGLAKAVVRVTSITASPSVVIHIQESSDNGAVDAFADVAVFPAITAVGIFEIPFRATEKYVRYSSVHADADSITFEVLVTTPEK